MRPTPAETIDGIVRILRETVAPAVGDSHARTQLHQVMTVLAQLHPDDPAAEVAAANESLTELLITCRRWVAGDAARGAHFGPIGTAAAAGPGFVAQNEAGRVNRSALETFLVELRAWRAQHGPDDSNTIIDHIGALLTGEPEEETQ